MNEKPNKENSFIHLFPTPQKKKKKKKKKKEKKQSSSSSDMYVSANIKQ